MLQNMQGMPVRKVLLKVSVNENMRHQWDAKISLHLNQLV